MVRQFSLPTKSSAAVILVIPSLLLGEREKDDQFAKQYLHAAHSNRVESSEFAPEAIYQQFPI